MLLHCHRYTTHIRHTAQTLLVHTHTFRTTTQACPCHFSPLFFFSLNSGTPRRCPHALSAAGSRSPHFSQVSCQCNLLATILGGLWYVGPRHVTQYV
jgi:hypothetical protein